MSESKNNAQDRMQTTVALCIRPICVSGSELERCLESLEATQFDDSWMNDARAPSWVLRHVAEGVAVVRCHERDNGVTGQWPVEE